MTRPQSRRPACARPARPPSAKDTTQLEALRAAVLARYDLFAAEHEAQRAAALAEQTAASSHLE